jgi:hypothetical protein
MDHAVALVEASLRVKGYFTVCEYLVFLRDCICTHWEVLQQAQVKDPVFGFLVMLEKARRGHIPNQEQPQKRATQEEAVWK